MTLFLPLADSPPDLPLWVAALWVAALAAFLVVLGVALKLAVRWIGVPCQFCDARLSYWDQLPPAERELLLTYFREQEGRAPYPAGVFVCTRCGTVFDDFSGLRLHRDYDAFGMRAFCKVCNAVMWNRKDLATWDGRSESPYMRCDTCGAVHQWKVYGRTPYRFLTPPPDAPVLPRCEDRFGVA